MIDLSCSVPSLFLHGELGYTAPQATRSYDDVVVVVEAVPRSREATARTVSPELQAAVRQEFITWPAAERTSISIANSLRARGHRWSHRQVCSCLERLRIDGVIVRRTNTNRKVAGRWLWRMK